jgi:hypothetical protein
MWQTDAYIKHRETRYKYHSLRKAATAAEIRILLGDTASPMEAKTE